jgi:hypothetical protein
MMHLARVCSFGCILALLAALAAPNEVVAQKKKKAADNGYAALPEDYKAIQNKKELVGEIVAVSGLVVTLRVDTPRVEANPKFKPPKGTTGASTNPQYRLWDDQQRLQRDLQQAQNAKTPQARAQAMQRYQQDLLRYQQEVNRINQQMLANAAKGMKSNSATDPYIVVHSYKEFDLETADKLAVRKMFLPMEFDDMGNVKTYTDKQKAELKDPKGGYVAKLEEAAPGMEAKILLTAPKKSKEAKADDDITDRPIINTIVLLKDSPSAGNIPAGDPKKKKK